MKPKRFQVLPLKVLASSLVVRQRLDYKEHLAGYTRRELDNLDKLAGRYQQIGTEMAIVKLDEQGEEVTMHEDVLSKPEPRSSLLALFEKKKEIVVEEMNEETRCWHFTDPNNKVWIDAHIGTLRVKTMCVDYDAYIEDGELVLTLNVWYWNEVSNETNLPLKGRQIFELADHKEYFSLDSEDNLVWKSVHQDFQYNYKVTHVVKLKRVASIRN